MPDRLLPPKKRRLPSIAWSRVVPAVVAGALLALAYPGINIEAGLWLGLLPLLWVLWRGDGGRPLKVGRAFRTGWLAGFTFFFITLRWLSYIHNGGVIGSLAAWILLSAYLALYVGLWSIFAVTIGRIDDAKLHPGGTKQGRWWQVGAAHSLRCAFLCGMAWVALEWVRGWMLTGFGWNGLGVGLHENATLMQAADLVGVTGLSFLPVFCACVLYATVRRLTIQISQRRAFASNFDFLLACLLVLLCFMYGVHRIATAPLPAPDGSDTLEVMIVQQNIPQEEKWDPALAGQHVQEYYDAIIRGVQDVRDAEAERISARLQEDGEVEDEALQALIYSPDLVVLPESALPFYLWEPATQDFSEAVMDYLPGTTLVTGINDSTLAREPVEYYNAVAVFPEGQTTAQTFHKVQLVPFGEYLPLRWFPGMEWLMGGIVPGDFTPGTSTEPLTIPHKDQEIDLIPLVCFEDTTANHVRRFVRQGNPQVMVNVTNNGWFPDPAGGLQHAANARFRAIELRRPLIRAANTGLSCVYDSRGRLTWTRADGSSARGTQEIRDPETGETQIRDVLHARVHLEADAEITLYARYGDWFSMTAAALALLAAGFHVYGLRRKDGEPTLPPA